MVKRNTVSSAKHSSFHSAFLYPAQLIVILEISVPGRLEVVVGNLANRVFVPELTRIVIVVHLRALSARVVHSARYSSIVSIAFDTFNTSAAILNSAAVVTVGKDVFIDVREPLPGLLHLVLQLR